MDLSVTEPDPAAGLSARLSRPRTHFPGGSINRDNVLIHLLLALFRTRSGTVLDI